MLSLSLTAEKEHLTLRDESGEIDLTGEYSLINSAHDSQSYRVTVGETIGYATVAVTEYEDERTEWTLVLTLGAYTLYFYAV